MVQITLHMSRSTAHDSTENGHSSMQILKNGVGSWGSSGWNVDCHKTI